ncbi:hypothetical protein ABDK09_00640 [Vibrio sp. CDRSL-10 TSBA]
MSVRLRRMVGSVVDDDLQQGLENWQNALAEAFMQCSRGQFSSQFNKACNDLLTQLRFYPLLPGQYEIVEGMCERLTMTFERLTQTIADNQTHISD